MFVWLVYVYDYTQHLILEASSSACFFLLFLLDRLPPPNQLPNRQQHKTFPNRLQQQQYMNRHEMMRNPVPIRRANRMYIQNFVPNSFSNTVPREVNASLSGNIDARLAKLGAELNADEADEDPDPWGSSVFERPFKRLRFLSSSSKLLVELVVVLTAGITPESMRLWYKFVLSISCLSSCRCSCSCCCLRNSIVLSATRFAAVVIDGSTPLSRFDDSAADILFPPVVWWLDFFIFVDYRWFWFEK